MATLGSTTRAADPELLQTLFEQSQDGVSLDDALRALSEMLGDHANAGEFEIDDEDFAAQARKELRSWIKLSLVVEREGLVYATDAFEEALRFASALGGRSMTSTASRLSVVQREIEGLESSLNPDPRSRSECLQGDQLLQLRHGDTPVRHRPRSPGAKPEGYAADPPINLQPPAPSATIVNANPRS